MTTARTWGGRSADQRRTERRERVIEAALEIWRESGWTGVTIRAVCARTGLNDRYFYEAFADRDELLVAAWEQVRDDMLAALGGVFADYSSRPLPGLIEQAASTVLQRISNDPGFGRILLLHHAGSPALEACRGEALQLTANLVVGAAQTYVRPDADLLALRIDAIASVGGFVELINAWQSGLLDCSADQIVQRIVHLVSVLGPLYLENS
ncbi:TetR/AcrR family transcriptional regulator [Nocardia uniformis]|uniref:TetR/AcrR family transcriptional regulator n=1 Tax=Nocardia uniformis TaxID=53432 RepID=UPI001FE0B29C|nr:TetR/AcrR family transcriptional regulator [Nocardia uniformis]